MLPPNTLLQNRYQIIRELGAGGMGAVYLASDQRLGNRQVVVKENQGGDPKQFQTEANILGSLSHANLPRVFDHFEDVSGARYLVMDYIAGQNLEEIVQQRGALAETEALGWMRQIFDAVEYLHQNRIIHRDIKPANIILTPQGKAVLVDFGIAKRMVTGRPTTTGARAATPGFSAPEQYAGGTSERSDIYSLCATLYALLTAQIPPEAPYLASGAAMLAAPHMFNPRITPTTEQVILRGMSIQTHMRFQSIGELRNALAGMSVSQPPLSQPSPPYTPPTQPYTPPTAPANNPIPVIVSALLGGLILLLACGAGIFIAFKMLPAATPAPTSVAVATTPRPGSAPPPPATTVAIPTNTPTPTLDAQQTALARDQRTQTAVSGQQTADALVAQQTSVSTQQTLAAMSAQQTQIALSGMQTRVSAQQTADAMNTLQAIQSAQQTVAAIQARQTLSALYATQTAAAIPPPAAYSNLINHYTQMCLAASPDGHIVQQTCNTQNNQRWKVTATTGTLRIEVKSGNCMGFLGGESFINPCSSSPAWTLVPFGNYSDIQARARTHLSPPHPIIETGIYFQINRGDGQCVDVDSWNHDENGHIVVDTCRNEDVSNQMWSLH